jgi:hypothetical protein
MTMSFLWLMVHVMVHECFEKRKQLLKYKNYILLGDIWWSKFLSTYKCYSFFQHQSVDICGSLRQLVSSIGAYYTLFYWSPSHFLAYQLHLNPTV